MRRFDDAFGDGFRVRTTSIDVDLGVRVRGLPHRIKPLHLGPIGRQGPPAVRRQPRDELVERHVEPDRHTIHIDRDPIVGIHERAATCGHDDVAEGQQESEDVALERPEIRLAAARENVRHRATLARFNQLVDVFRAPAQPLRERTRDGRFIGRHETDEIDLVGRHRVSRASSSKKPGYETSTDDAPLIVVGAAARVAAIAKAIASR